MPKVANLIDYWPCGHERTKENTRLCGVAGVRCKKCRQAIDAKHYAKKFAKRKPKLKHAA